MSHNPPAGLTHTKGSWVAAAKHRWMDRPIYTTLEAMAGKVNADLETESVVSLARRLVAGAGRENQGAQAMRIRVWLASVWKFVDDPLEREYLRTPAALVRDFDELGFVPGDCDEAATLGAALAKSVGLRATFTVLAFAEPETGHDTFSHVYASVLTDDAGEIDLDVTRPAGPVPEPTRHATVDV